MAATSEHPVTSEATGGVVSDAVPRRFAGGDGLRAIAALSVLVFHAAIAVLIWKLGSHAVSGEGTRQQFKPLFGPFAAVFVNMRAGVYIFFVLSGYLLTRSFLASYLLGTPRPSVGRYFRNRALRIIPGFWVATTIFLTWQHAWTPNVLSIITTYGFAGNYHPTAMSLTMGQAWTLDLEVAFYILVPVSALLFLRFGRGLSTPARRLALVLGVLAAAYVGSLYCKHLAGNPIKLSYNLADYLFAFIPGIVLAALEPFLAPRLRASGRGRSAGLILFVVSLALFGAFISVPVSSDGLRVLLISLACGALVGAPLIAQWGSGRGWAILDNRVMRWLGERSYGIYLIHLGLMNHVLGQFGHGHSLGVTFALLLIGITVSTLIAADLLWRFVERPALERRLPWRQAEFGSRRGAAAASVAASPSAEG